MLLLIKVFDLNKLQRPHSPTSPFLTINDDLSQCRNDFKANQLVFSLWDLHRCNTHTYVLRGYRSISSQWFQWYQQTFDMTRMTQPQFCLCPSFKFLNPQFPRLFVLMLSTVRILFFLKMDAGCNWDPFDRIEFPATVWDLQGAMVVWKPQY